MIQFLATHHVRAHWLRKPLHDEVDLRPDSCSHPNPHFLSREKVVLKKLIFGLVVASHRYNINLELVLLLLGVEPLKCIHKCWVTLARKDKVSWVWNNEVRRTGEGENEDGVIVRKVMFGHLEEVRPGEHEW